ncbi:MAG: TlpA family protein disulfide reductase [Chitinophagales bacterium]|jgi:thiol-disulfide isomerase/thioredoxin|nr:TlpA family protein disulfide reductase [Chitinophagales bacterium]
MKTISLTLLITLNFISGFAQDLRIVSYPELERIISASSQKPTLVNLWATWCKPCVEELPYFISAQERFKDEVEFIFVSLDFMSQTPKVKEMIKKLSMHGTMIQLNEPGGDWIDKMDNNWSGAIPYTLLYLPNGKKWEHYDAFSSLEDLTSFLNTHLPK